MTFSTKRIRGMGKFFDKLGFSPINWVFQSKNRVFRRKTGFFADKLGFSPIIGGGMGQFRKTQFFASSPHRDLLISVSIHSILQLQIFCNIPLKTVHQMNYVIVSCIYFSKFNCV